VARRKKGRDIHGILLLDKPTGISSNKALQEVRCYLNARKGGHTGSLDPLATGLLPLCFGEATKVSAMMLDDDKSYDVVIQLGVMTDTGDKEGQIIQEKPVPILTQTALEECFKHFTGEIEQVPPMYSALKYEGRKLYELAREGIEVERKARRIRIDQIQLLDWQADSLSLRVDCSKGTYIRSLAEDIGQYLGTCATVKALRRIRAGLFDLQQAMTLDEIKSLPVETVINQLIEVDKPLEALPAVQVSEEQAACIRQGQQLPLDKPKTGLVRMYCQQVFLGLGEMRMDGKLAPRKLFHLGTTH
jgi:tRNA pseudouridine55 synthase